MEDGTDGEADRKTFWLVRDRADDLYLTRSGTWREYRQAGGWTSPEGAARALLGVDPDRFGSVELVRETRIRERAGTPASDVLPPPRRWGAVPASWVGAAGAWDAKGMLNTLRVTESRGVDPADLPAVMEIYAEVTGRTPTGMRPR